MPARRSDAPNSIVKLTGIPPGWMERSLGDAIRIIGGGTPDRNESAYWRDGSVPWITTTDLTANAGKYIASGAECITEQGLQGSNATLVPPGAIVFSMRGTVASAAIASAAVTCNQSCEILLPRSSEVDSQFFYYLLSLGKFAFLRMACGTTFAAITRRDIRRVRFAFPPLEEQAAIARILDAVDTSIERTRDAIARARDLKRALTQRLLREGVRGETQRRSRIGHVPASWKVVPVDAVALRFGYGLSVPMQLDGAIPILRMGNIQDGDVVLEDIKYVSLPARITEPYIARRGDVFFNRTNSQEHVGKVGIYRSDVPSVFASYLIRVVPNPEVVNSYFLGQVLNSHDCQCRIKRFATPGVQQVNINATNLGRVLMPLPVGADGLREQEQIAAILEKADECIRLRRPVLERHVALKRSLMHDLLAGRVRVTT